MNQQALLLKGIEDGVYPETLFKFRGISRGKQILKDCTFRFSSPTAFNDPFDCSLDEVASYKMSEIKNFFNKNNFGYANLPLDRRNLIKQDKSIVSKWVQDAKNKAVNSRGVLALSRDVNEILLWSHYADYHKGLAIELSLREDLDFFLGPRIIKYVDNYTPTNYLSDPEGTVDAILSKKHVKWEYEKEFRIYKTDSANIDISINPNAIKSVYFGLKAKQSEIDDVRSICSTQALSHVRFFQAEKVYGQFKLRFKLL
ncbi:DUF2971 domain-containing protein [Pantoea sp. Al-1710]|uniref:DUF2971 domain-containing protein n=1 Tax=Candidatus Pantoea communis TaxID=2608354 RepID=A0ABX0RUC1_9GAMM|nr:DUF2971 domain-containing protein [Pantoea communis]NIG21186.1 DUF2971 domain-containing protein [Pantoea communis]